MWHRTVACLMVTRKQRVRQKDDEHKIPFTLSTDNLSLVRPYVSPAPNNVTLWTHPWVNTLLK